MSEEEEATEVGGRGGRVDRMIGKDQGIHVLHAQGRPRKKFRAEIGGTK